MLILKNNNKVKVILILNLIIVIKEHVNYKNYNFLMKFTIFKFKSVTSTNDIAINLIKKQQKETGCVYAEIQTKGRGTHGKEWISDKGNLFGSIFFLLSASRIAARSAIAGTPVKSCIKTLVGEKTISKL